MYIYNIVHSVISQDHQPPQDNSCAALNPKPIISITLGLIPSRFVYFFLVTPLFNRFQKQNICVKYTLKHFLIVKSPKKIVYYFKKVG